ncbi:MAG: hypothetical protein ABI583_14310 [Betaproteobacteria bacterium]
MSRTLNAFLFIATLLCGSDALAQVPIEAGNIETPVNQFVKQELFPQFEYLFEKLVTEREHTQIDGVAAFNGKDKFLPGKIAVGLSHLLLNTPREDPRFARFLRGYRDVAQMTVGMDNETWGVYYYLLALNKLKQAGLLDQAIDAATLATLKRKLDWRRFVTTPDYKLIKLPTNYYGVAFSVARLRLLLGWEDDTGSKALLARMLAHYEKYSGKYGFSDETDGDGRFDRYSILLIAEVCQRYIETGLTVTPELKALLRKSADVAFNLGAANGEGFTFGRSIGPYGDTAIMEILTVAALLNVLTPEEKQYAYTYTARIVERYARFWYDPKMRSVDMWGKGRRTDAYRGKHRILGENFSLLHQLVSASEAWGHAGFNNIRPKIDLAAWLERTQPTFNMVWFARGEYDRALAIFRDHQHVFSLLMVNGGVGQHDNSPYYPLPFATDIIAGVADSGAKHAQLLPKFKLVDGSELLPTTFVKDIRDEKLGSQYRIDYRQDELTRLGSGAPIKDARLKVATRYTLEPGLITRTDTFTPTVPVEIAEASLEFASFSRQGTRQGTADGARIEFKQGVVTSFEVEGLGACIAEALADDPDYRSTIAAMNTRVRCARGPFMLDKPVTVRWTLRYR